MDIHNTATVSKKAKLAEGVSVGPYCIIGDNVAIGKGTKIAGHCLIEGNTTIGQKCEIFNGAVIGSRPQDLKYKGEESFLEIGDSNVIREYCTLNPGTNEGGKTCVGSNNLFMAYTHIAHDCSVGSGCVFANNATLAGHVSVDDQAMIGGLSAVHQFVRIGRLSMIGGCSKAVQDVPPFSTCDGHPARVYGLNITGLKRHNFDRNVIRELHRAFKILFNCGLPIKNALERAGKELPQIKEVACLLDFIKSSERGIIRSCREFDSE